MYTECLQNMPVIVDDDDDDEFVPTSSTTFIKYDMNRDSTWDDVSIYYSGQEKNEILARHVYHKIW